MCLTLEGWACVSERITCVIADDHPAMLTGLFISPETVRPHVRKAMAKLEADTRTQAVAIALRQSLIS